LDTSVEAFEVIKPRINALHHQVLDATRKRGGATVSEVVQDTGLIYGTVLRRMSELKRAGLLRNSDTKRRNERGRAEVVAIAA
jgi:predicted transcriptional regulator